MTSSQFETFISERTGLPKSRIGLASRFLRGLGLWPYTQGPDARQVNAQDIAQFLIALSNPYDKQQFECTCNARDTQSKTFLRFLTEFIHNKQLANGCLLIAISATNDIYGGQVFWEISGQKVARSFVHNPRSLTGESLLIPGGLIKEIHLLLHENEMVLN